MRARIFRQSLLAGVASVWCSFVPSSAAPATITREIDPAHSRASFSVTHLYVTKVTGTVPVTGGTVVLTEGSALPQSVSAVLDARRLDTHDDDRNDSLQGPDWFDTKQFPQWTFVSTAITPGDGRSFTLDGTITIHGVTQPVRLTVASDGSSYHAQGRLDRHAFGMRKTPLDGTIGDDLSVSIDVTLK